MAEKYANEKFDYIYDNGWEPGLVQSVAQVP